jgi:hypothetical protein
MDNVELRGRVECGRRHLWQCHSTDPGFARKTVNPAAVFAQGAIFQIIIFHLKDDNFLILNYEIFLFPIQDFPLFFFILLPSIFNLSPKFPNKKGANF